VAEFVGDVNRKLVPRWRSSELTLMLGEMRAKPGSPPPSFGADDFAEKLSNWSAAPTLSSAAELLSAGFVHCRLGEVQEAAEYILECGDTLPGLLRDLASRATNPFDATDPDESEESGTQIKSERRLLSVEPRNPLKWVDLARNYLLIGKPRKATRCMDTALQLAPNARFVLRSAVRLLVHLRNLDRAHEILNRSEVLAYDPTLIAAEIAVSALMKRTSPLFRRGLKLLDSGEYAESQLSELAAVIGTEELEHGPARRARQLFRRSLLKPNENTVAQARWAAARTQGIEFDPSYLQVARSFEARAWNQFSSGDWAQTLIQSKAWLSDQGFSRRPAGLGSFVAAVTMEDHIEAIAILRRGLLANPGDPLLLNNLAYSCACLGQINAAEQALQRIAPRSEDPASASISVMKTATAGLVEYRRGNPQLGRSLYLKAFELARNANLDPLRARLVMFFALEELRAGFDLTNPVTQAAIEIGERTSDPVLRLLLERIVKSRKAQ
jgi:tetratricopeptide (TPR) repeat protein